MHANSTRWLWAIAGFCAVGALAAPIRVVQVTQEPPAGGQQIISLRMTPSENMECSKVVFDCYYHQEFPWETKEPTKQTNETRVHEPVVFTYRRKDVKLVEDLDCCIDFRVPIAMDKLVEIHGTTTFATNYPVAVKRLRVTGYVKDQQAWAFEVPAEGTHAVKDAPPPAVQEEPISIIPQPRTNAPSSKPKFR